MERDAFAESAMRNWWHCIWLKSLGSANGSKSRDGSCLPSTDDNQMLVMRSSGFCATVSLGNTPRSEPVECL